MAAPIPLTPDEITRLRALHASGASRNDIARELGRSGSTISRACTRLGLSFDRSEVEAATAARIRDAQARRSALMVGLLEDAERMRGQLFAPCTLHNFGGKDNTHNSIDLDEPVFRDKRDIVHSVATAVASSLRLAEFDSDDGVQDAASLVKALAAGLHVAAGMLGSEGEVAGADRPGPPAAEP